MSYTDPFQTLNEKRREASQIIHSINLTVTKREYFAVMALQGVLSNVDTKHYVDACQVATDIADTLIERLEKTKS